MSDRWDDLRAASDRLASAAGDDVHRDYRLAVETIQDHLPDLLAENKSMREVVRRAEGIAHAASLFSGGAGDRDFVVGLIEWAAQQDATEAELDALTAEVERLRALAETVHEYIASAECDPDGLAGEDVWLRMQCRAAALTEGDDRG